MIIKMRKNNMLCFLLLAVIAIVFGFNSAPAQATYSCYGSSAMVNLYAGQALNIGTVTTCTDGNNLYVKYTTNGDWVLTETHLAVATSISSIPQTQVGNPKVGRFPYQATHASLNEYSYVIDLEQANYSEGTQLYIAAHADVLLLDEQGYVACEETAWGDGDGFSGESWATYFTYEVGPPILGPEGGTFEGDGGVVVSVPPGATDEYVTINIEVVEEDGLAKDVPPNCIFMGAAKLDIEDVVLSNNADITIPCPPGVPENAEIYVAKVVEYAGTQMFMMVDTATVQGDTITSQDPAFPGILGSGTFVFLWTENVGWVEGQVTNINSGIAVPEAVVTLSGGYWLDIADAIGHYSLPAWAGNFVVNAFDDQTGDFGEKQGFMPNDGATVLIDVEIGESSGPTQSTLVNGDFEDGLTGWVLSGAGDVVESFGPISPYEGSYMAMISSGSGAVGGSSSALEQSFTVPEGANKLIIHYNFISEEYPEFVGSQFNDVMCATLHTPDGSREIAFEEVNSANFQPVSGIPCGSGDCTWGQTGWITASIDVSQWAGTNDTLTLTVHDVGDTIYDTVVLLDSIGFLNPCGLPRQPLFRIDNPSCEDQWRMAIYYGEVYPQLVMAGDMILKKINGELDDNYMRNITIKTATAILSVYQLGSLSGNNAEQLFAIGADESFQFWGTLSGNEFAEIWLGALGATIEVSLGNPSGIAGYIGSNTLGILNNAYSAWQVSELTERMVECLIARTLLLEYYMYGRDITLLHASYNLEPTAGLDELIHAVAAQDFGFSDPWYWFQDFQTENVSDIVNLFIALVNEKLIGFMN